MRKKCLILTCSHCNDNVVLDQIENPIANSEGGEIKFYEDPPVGWTNFNGSDLCPECSDILNGMIDAFVKPNDRQFKFDFISEGRPSEKEVEAE